MREGGSEGREEGSGADDDGQRWNKEVIVAAARQC